MAQKTLGELMHENANLSNIFKACRDLPNQGDASQALKMLEERFYAQGALSLDTLIDEKREDELLEIFSEISSIMIKTISQEENGIVLNQDGSLNVEASVVQAMTNPNVDIPPSVEAQYGEKIKQVEDTYHFLKKGQSLSDYFMHDVTESFIEKNYIGENQYGNLFDKIMGTFSVPEYHFNDKGFTIGSGENAQSIEYTEEQKARIEKAKTPEEENEIKNEILAEYFNVETNKVEFGKDYKKDFMDTWLNEPKDVKLMAGLCTMMFLEDQAQKNGETKANIKARERTLRKYPELVYFIEDVDNDGKYSLNEAGKELAGNYMKRLTRIKTRDTLLKDAVKAKKGELKFEELGDTEKALYLRNSMMAMAQEDTKDIGFYRLLAIGNGIATLDKNGKQNIEFDNFLKLYKSVVRKKTIDYKTPEEFVEGETRKERFRIVHNVLRPLENQVKDGTFKKIDFSKKNGYRDALKLRLDGIDEADFKAVETMQINIEDILTTADESAKKQFLDYKKEKSKVIKEESAKVKQNLDKKELKKPKPKKYTVARGPKLRTGKSKQNIAKIAEKKLVHGDVSFLSNNGRTEKKAEDFQNFTTDVGDITLSDAKKIIAQEKEKEPNGVTVEKVLEQMEAAAEKSKEKVAEDDGKKSQENGQIELDSKATVTAIMAEGTNKDTPQISDAELAILQNQFGENLVVGGETKINENGEPTLITEAEISKLPPEEMQVAESQIQIDESAVQESREENNTINIAQSPELAGNEKSSGIKVEKIDVNMDELAQENEKTTQTPENEENMEPQPEENNSMQNKRLEEELDSQLEELGGEEEPQPVTFLDKMKKAVRDGTKVVSQKAKDVTEKAMGISFINNIINGIKGTKMLGNGSEEKVSDETNNFSNVNPLGNLFGNNKSNVKEQESSIKENIQMDTLSQSIRVNISNEEQKRVVDATIKNNSNSGVNKSESGPDKKADEGPGFNE